MRGYIGPESDAHGIVGRSISRRALIAAAGSTALTSATQAGAPDVSIDRSCRVSRDTLDRAVARVFADFNKPAVLPDFNASTMGAQFDCELHRVTTTTIHPKTGQVSKVTGLLALPVDTKRQLPLISWQHGTLFSYDQVPSNLTRLVDPSYEPTDATDSLETLFNLQRFVGQGFALIAADYVGKGPLRGNSREAYAVKDVSVRTCLDMLAAGEFAMEQLGFTTSKLFLHGWSQGALNTQWLHQDLRKQSRPIAATSVASPFNDINEAWRYWAGAEIYSLPVGVATYPAIPSWISLCQVLALASYEEHYGLDGLLKAAVRPEHLGMAEKFWNDYQLDTETLAGLPSGSEFLVPGFFDRFTASQNSAFLRQLADNRATYWNYDSPIRFYYGLGDEAIHPGMVYPALAAGGKYAKGVSVPNASHRVTFLASMYGSQQYLDGADSVLSWFQDVS